MRAVDPFEADDTPTLPSRPGRFTYSASRVLAGHCPECGKVLVVFNDGESWPLVACSCGWRGATTEFPSVRLDPEGARDVLVDVRGYFPEGALLRVRRPRDEPVLGTLLPVTTHPNEPAKPGVETLGKVNDVGLVSLDYYSSPSWAHEAGRARVVVRGPEPT